MQGGDICREHTQGQKEHTDKDKVNDRWRRAMKTTHRHTCLTHTSIFPPPSALLLLSACTSDNISYPAASTSDAAETWRWLPAVAREAEAAAGRGERGEGRR